MWNVLIIAKREIMRFRTRFSGSSRGVIVLVLLASLLVSYFIAQSGFSLNRGFYTIGVSPDGPVIDDSRFNVLILGLTDGYQKLQTQQIDAYIYGERVIAREDSRSRYAVGALKQYLDSLEQSRIQDEYSIDRAFPLRVQVYNLSVNTTDRTTSRSVADLIGPIAPTPEPWVDPWVDPGTPGVTPVPTSAPEPTTSATDDAVREQLNGSSSRFKAQTATDGEVMVPSLYEPSVPLPQVILAFLYIVPMFFISVFFTSSFMDEKTNRKLNILMSTPVSAFEIILGKMLPYLVFSLAVIVGVTLYLGGDLLLAVAIFGPISLFIFAVYLMVALFYRTYKDQTFFSMTAITFVTGYLVFPALFAGMSNLSYISPLTLAVQMYRGVPFGTTEWLGYVFSTGPLFLVFGVRIFNEEYLMGYGRLHQKTGDAIYLAISKRHPCLSVAALSILLIPAVFIVELIILTLVMNIGQWFVMLIVLLFFCAMVEEIAKSAGIAVLIEYGKAASLKRVLGLSFISALAFWGGEKLLLVLSLGFMPASGVLDALNGATGQATSPLMVIALLLLPLAGHFVFTSVVCVGTLKLGTKYYLLSLLCGTLVHVLYNVYNLRAMGAF
jgi:hypothetical protein